MNRHYLTWLVITLAVILLVGYSNNWVSIVFLLVGLATCLYAANHKQGHSKGEVEAVSTLPLIIGLVLILLSLIFLPNFWLIVLAIFIAYVVIQYSHGKLDGESNKGRATIQYINVDEEGSSENDFFNFKRWFLGEHQGKETFSWENFQYYSVYGDSLIDLTNTIVPRKTNVLGIHKVMGNIKVIVPVGTGVALHVNSYRTTLRFQGKQYGLQNEKIVLENVEYDSNPRKIHLTITQGWGNVEVIFL